MVKKLCLKPKECVYFSIVKMKSRKHIFFSTLFIFCSIHLFQSCSNDSEFSEEKPKRLIEKEKMKKIMYKMMLLESTSQLKFPNLLESKKTIGIVGNKLLRTFGEDSISYAQSFNYYASNKELIETMLNEIVEKYNIELVKYN